MIFTVEIPENAMGVKVEVLCDGKRYHCNNSRYRPGYWNGLQGGQYYGQYFDMEDVNRVREMAEVASALEEYGIRYDLQKLKRQYRITISNNDYYKMCDSLKERILKINCFHDNSKTGKVIHVALPETVRCKDCRFYDVWTLDPPRGNCTLHHKVRIADWFCADGGRRDAD